jgi:hypothetical protein
MCIFFYYFYYRKSFSTKHPEQRNLISAKVLAVETDVNYPSTKFDRVFRGAPLQAQRSRIYSVADERCGDTVSAVSSDAPNSSKTATVTPLDRSLVSDNVNDEPIVDHLGGIYCDLSGAPNSSMTATVTPLDRALFLIKEDIESGGHAHNKGGQVTPVVRHIKETNEIIVSELCPI